MKNSNVKMISQKKQAVINIVMGCLIILMVIIKLIGKMQHSTVLQNVSNIVFPFALGIIIFIFGVSLNRRKQTSDELSRELMLRAGSITLFIELFVIIAMGIAMEIIGSSRGNVKFGIEGIDVMLFGTFICGVNIAARNAVFLWLDRIPKAEEEE